MISDGELKFRFDWEPAPGVRSPELRATWARLEIWVGDACVTQVEDSDSQSIRRSIYVPLYPLAEWVAYNWWFLRAHSRPASLVVAPGSVNAVRDRPPALVGVLDHHSLRAVGDGFLWPNLTIVPEGGHTHLIWYSDDAATAERPLKYIRSGEAWINSTSVEHSLAQFVESIVTRLTEQGIHESSLQKEWEELRETDPEEAAFCLAAARLGLDPYSEALDLEDSIERAAVTLGAALIDDFFDAVSPQRMLSGIDWIIDSTRKIDEQRGEPSDAGDLRPAVEASPIGTGPRPWDLGYAQAARVRRVLGLEAWERFEVGNLMSLLMLESHDVGLQAFGRTAGRSNVLVLGRPMIAQSQRFAQARALWHFLFGAPTAPFLVTPARTDRQRVERAFAAEVLAPAAGIRERLEPGELGFALDEIETIAGYFDVSSMVIRHQIDNQVLSRS
jgi:hypothetical protein